MPEQIPDAVAVSAVLEQPDDDRYVIIDVRKRGYLGDSYQRDRVTRLVLEAQAINADLGTGDVDVDEAYRQLQRHSHEAYARSLEQSIDLTSRANPRRLLDAWRLRRTKRWLDTHPRGYRTF